MGIRGAGQIPARSRHCVDTQTYVVLPENTGEPQTSCNLKPEDRILVILTATEDSCLLIPARPLLNRGLFRLLERT